MCVPLSVGCLKRVFDLRNDPYEQMNILSGPGCFVHFNKFDLTSLAAVIDKEIGIQYCTELFNSKNQSTSTSTSTLRRRSLLEKKVTCHSDVPILFRNGNQDERKEMKKLLNETHNQMIIRSLSTVSTPLSSCVRKYHKNIMTKILFLFPQLSAFVLYGNMAYKNFIMETQLYGNSTCNIPIATDLKGLNYTLSPGMYVRACQNFCSLVYDFFSIFLRRICFIFNAKHYAQYYILYYIILHYITCIKYIIIIIIIINISFYSKY